MERVLTPQASKGTATTRVSGFNSILQPSNLYLCLVHNRLKKNLRSYASALIWLDKSFYTIKKQQKEKATWHCMQHGSGN
eukprot:scaffold322944_cov13-Tisochrysis_lutea.AAC.1